MQIKVTKNLKLLASLFNQKGYKLYIVGGYVRDSLLGVNSTDVDICSNALPREVNEILNGTKFKAISTINSLGTVIIKADKEIYEYTTFRQESYKNNGEHCPAVVEFVDDIVTDCKRRDFTINSIYFDIEANKIIDFCNGVQDLKNKIIRIVDLNETFKQDGLRILRMIRLMGNLNFKIDKFTLTEAKNNIQNLKKISKERIVNEFMLILSAHKKHNQSLKVIKKCLFCLQSLNAFGYIFVSLHEYKHILEGKRFLKFALKVKNEVLLEAIVLDIYNYLTNNNCVVSIEQILNYSSIKLSKEELSKSKAILSCVMSAKREKIDFHFIANHFNVLSQAMKLLRVVNRKGQLYLKKVYKQFKNLHLPKNLNELEVKGNELEEFVNLKCEIKIVLEEIFNKILNLEFKNNRREIFAYLKENKCKC